ncbi:MAG: hypothetical protein E6I75_18685, partial [Chloroflexi bacterium]
MQRWTMSRRNVLKLGALGAGSLLLPIARLAPSLADSVASSPTVPLFQIALPTPAELTPTATTTVTTPAGVKTSADLYQLTARVGLAQILPGFQPTKIWGYNGLAPGPLFRGQRGKPAVVRLTNALTTADTGSVDLGLSTHLHGGNVDGFSDGHPVNEVLPGFTKDYTYFNDQPA